MKDQKIEEYWISVKQLMTPETVVIDQPPFFTSVSPNPIKMYVAEFFRNGKLQRRKIKTHPAYPYGFLREEMQDYILDPYTLSQEHVFVPSSPSYLTPQ